MDAGGKEVKMNIKQRITPPHPARAMPSLPSPSRERVIRAKSEDRVRGYSFLALLFLLLSPLPASAGEYAYAPEGCEFRMEFPGEPYQSQRCNPDLPSECHDVTTYTKVFGMDATLNFHVTCNPAEEGMFDKYTGDVLQTTLEAMVGNNHLEEYQTGYQELDVAKQAVILGVGKAGGNEKVYIAQLWIGHKSAFTVEAELIGDQTTAAADDMFANILHSIRHESWEKAAPIKRQAAPALSVEGEQPPPQENAAPHDNPDEMPAQE